MSIKTILCVVGMNYDDEDLSFPIKLSQEAEAHLTLVVVSLEATSPVGDYAITDSSLWIEERQRISELLASKVNDLKQHLAGTQLSYEVEGTWLDVVWAESDIGERARYADLLLIGPSALADSELKKAVLNAGLFEAMCPVLLAPQGSKPTLKPNTVLLAWDSSLEATRATREALDVMAAATIVHVTMVDPDASRGRNGEEPGADIALYLTRHDVAVTADRLPSGGLDIADVLRKHAIDVSADILVMGGYGHSRLRERVFGGLTRSFTSNPPLPVFIAR